MVIQMTTIAEAKSLEIRERAESFGLRAPESYWKATAAELVELTGGCGPGKFGDYLVPDTIWGLNITPACQIHDWCYRAGSEVSKNDADLMFLGNIVRLIRANTNSKILSTLRYLRAMKYFVAVEEGGDSSYVGQL